jgi:hypothetical protein
VAQGKKLLDAEPQALIAAAMYGDLTQVRRILAACLSTPDPRLRTREDQTPARPTPPNPTPLSACSWSIPHLPVLPLLQIRQIIAAGGNLEVKFQVCRCLLSIFLFYLFLITPAKDATTSSDSRSKRF